MNIDLNRFRETQVLVVGDVMLDTYWHGQTSRISPEAPVPIVKVDREESRLGGAANAALNMATLGAQTRLIGIAGEDDAGRALEQMLDGADIANSLTMDADYRTITKLRLISRHQQLIRADFEQAPTPASINSIVESVSIQLAKQKVVLLSDYGKGTLEHSQKIISLAREHGKPVLVDPKGADFQRYANATILTPNRTEFEQVVGICQSESELITKATQLIASLHLDALLITRSEQGMTLIKATGEHHHFPAQAKEVFDVTGAGDTVIATLAVAIAAGEDMETAVALANVAAGIVVGKLGTATVSAPELKYVIDAQHELERGILSRDQLVDAVQNARASNKKIVFTNGCFDILHAGHVGYLQDARQLGDRLIVAVNDDASVKRLKGESRPVNSLDRRMRVLSALQSVDWVVAFDEDTPEDLLHLIRPDILVKGGDYSLQQVVGADIVSGYGGKVEVLSVEDNCSTSATIEKIIKQA